MRRMQAVVVFTERDERALAPLAGATPLVRVPLSAPARAHPLDPLGHAPPAILFVGSFIHPPNVDAAMRLVADVFPRVRARHPEARLWIVGDQPPPALRAAADDRVVVTGRVPDVTPYLDGAAVVVAPLREGGGMRVKVLEALGAGKALVATPLAASGMGLTAGEHALLVETDEEIAEAIAELVEHPARRAALGAAAFALLGFAALDVVIRPALSALGAASGVLGVAGRASAEAGTGAGAVVRAVAGRLISGAESASVFWVLLLAAGVLLLLRLVSGYHRASARD